MNKELKEKIPKYFWNDIIFISYLIFNRKKKSIIFLVKNLNFYEFDERSGLVASIDLSSTLLKDLTTNEINRILHGKVTSDQQVTPPPRSQSSSFSVEPESDSGLLSVVFGKYILNYGECRRIFLLLKVCDKLIVLERKDHKFDITKEYYNVDYFAISDPNGKQEANIYVRFYGCDDEEEIIFDNDPNMNFSNELEDNKTIRDMLETIKQVRTAYFIHKTTTVSEFLNLKNYLTFGPNSVRTQKVEEKQILSRCSDIWMNIYDDKLVIGIPIANVCGESLRIVSNS